MKLGINDARLIAIGNAIRDKKGTQDFYTLADMPDAIASIETGYPEPTGTISITQNGTQNVKDYASANVNVPNSYGASDEGKVVDNGALVAQTSRTIDENGTYDTTLNNEVVVDVEGATLITKTITQNGTYNAEDDDADGYSEVTVDVSGGGGEEVDFYAIKYTPNSNGNTSRSAGWRFTTDFDTKVKGVRFFARETTASVYISDTQGNTIASKTNVTVVADQWNDVLFDNPITLSANTDYVVWGSHATVAMKYRSGIASSPLITYIGGCYSTSFSTFPSTNDGSNIYGVDLIIAVGGGSSSGIPLIAQADWDELTKEEKWAYGLVAIQSEVSGFERGILVNGADYKPAPTLVYSVSRNGNSLGSLSYTFDETEKYQIIGAYVQGGTNVKQEITFELNGNAVSASYSYPSQNNNVALNLFTLEVEASENDVLTMTNTVAYANSGMQLFVIKDADINNIDLYDSRGNNGQTFNIAIDGYYLQVSQFGYYQNNNNFVLREIDNVVKTSTPTPNNSAYWYGGMYVLTL